MGSDDAFTYPADGEDPKRSVRVKDFEISKCEVTNKEFKEFVDATGYVSDSEKFGWSFVFIDYIPPETLDTVDSVVQAARHWGKVDGAFWYQPEGPLSNISDRLDHPVVQVSWNDGYAYCKWKGGRLPWEKEWEYAARGGLQEKIYVWGDEMVPKEIDENGNEKDVYMCNFFQGEFPEENTALDGYRGTAPVASYPANGFGLYDMAGNVWEW
eukprot:CAMPEP_0174263822 /NCGR_PEP_ID=MMETSP0439-20130205/20216_1 /TAXON_ID=0 /ORGANISM="Stereomyxa ramosa, Strain Chinc5" /LENGTH=211 /DNA_ID=CAMNT_0015349395 /DNA_START=14 /DNA_END=646 /DNA_ORIENTATION=-